MLEKTVTFYGEKTDANSGMPEPFYRYLIVASKLPTKVAVASVVPVTSAPVPTQTHFASKRGTLSAVAEKAINALKAFPAFSGLKTSVE